MYKTLNYCFRDMLYFDFVEKGLWIVPPLNFVYDFSRKMFFMLHYINWPNFVVWFTLLLEILGNMCIAIVCFPICDVINFEINLIFVIKPFFCMTKTSRQKFKYLENKKMKWKEFLIVFKGLSVAKNCLRPESASSKSQVAFSPLMPGGNKKVTHTVTNLQLRFV